VAIVKWVLIGALATLPAAAQEKKEEAPSKPKQETVKRIIPVKYADVRSLADMLGIFGCGIMRAVDLKVLAVSCPSEALVTAIEEAVKRLDVPPPAVKNVELTAYFLLGGEKELHEGKPVPPELEPVVKQIRSAFAYKNFGLLDTLVLRTRAGQPARVNGVVQVGTPPGGSTGTSAFAIGSATPSADGGVVRIDRLSASIIYRIRTPTSDSGRGAEINADVDIREGQKVVVGKSSLEGPDKALIVVLTAKVL
jgi:hypothetical protein